jgi:hypothetical protein
MFLAIYATFIIFTHKHLQSHPNLIIATFILFGAANNWISIKDSNIIDAI